MCHVSQADGAKLRSAARAQPPEAARFKTRQSQNTFVIVAKNVVCNGFDTAILPEESGAPVV